MSLLQKSDKSIRAFIAVEISEEVQENLEAIISALKKNCTHVRWVPKKNIHLSLAFLGNIPQSIIKQLCDALDEVSETISPFSFDIADIGAFGDRRSLRVIWAGIHNADQLKTLQKRISDSLRSIGLTLESREFKPHLTLGRVRSRQDSDSLRKMIDEVGSVAFGKVNVSRVLLMKSALCPTGAEYSILHRALLKRNNTCL